ncbi:mechanosensitive channel MscK [Buttiauxella noackiae]|uniref:Potassium efflux system protein/small-conductance mechanosensitive channel n=2 Tax=Buttiauxella TaxID=82976 RepID=A0A1B7I1S2_9ENTR|nr:mechanosensitive channel MscK [Buttiauxella noackiae]OAT22080.1 potassium efflux system protein/small-conductance mechanosensitive channel [Buttiauxella noackiae ATCC 51607]
MPQLLCSLYSRRLSARFFLIAFVSLLCVLAQPVWAQKNGSDLPSRDEIQNQLSALNKQKTLSPNDKLTQQDLNETLEVLDKIDRLKDEAEKLHQQIVEAPKVLRKATDALNEIKSQQVNAANEEAEIEALSLRQLETRLSELVTNLQNAQSDLATWNSQLISLQTQPERVQNAMNAASAQLETIRNRLNGVTPGAADLRPSQQTLLLAQQALLNAQLQQQSESLKGNTILQDALQKQRDYTNAHINQMEITLQLLQKASSSKRLTLTQQTAQDAIDSEDTVKIQQNPLVKQELDINHQLSQRLIDATQHANEMVPSSIRIKNTLDRALQSERNLKEQIAVLKGSLLLSRILYQQQQQNLPSAEDTEDLTNRIADIRLEQFDVNQQRDALFQPDELVAKIEDGHKADVTPEVHDALLQVLDTRRELLDQLNKQLGMQLMLAINLQNNQQQLQNVTKSLDQILTEQIFWVTSNKPMDWDWLKSLPSSLRDQFKNASLNFKGPENSLKILAILLLMIPALLLAGVIRWRFKAIDRYLEKQASRVGQLRNDSQMLTPKAIALTLVKVLPGALVIYSIGLVFAGLQMNISESMLAFCKQLSLFWLVFGLTYQVLSKNGVAVSHFNMQPQLCSHYRRQLVRIGCALLPLLFWSVLGERSPLHLVEDALGQLIIFFNLLLITALVFPMCRENWRNKNNHTMQLFTVTMMGVVPAVLIVLTAMGYFYTTLRLAGRWIETIYLILVWNLVYQTVLRGLSVAARRMAYRRAVARRENLVKEGAEGGEPVEEPPLALDQINQQTMRLAIIALFALFALVFYTIWSDLFGVFGYLDSIQLWSYSASEAGVAVVKNVTMGSLLFAAIAFAVAWVLIRNLPGLLEVLVLSRLQMRQGASYAITTILNYVITAVGAMTIFGSLGVSWDKLQWLAAALSVGLGFGLQEIFGNFVSGLIILFERPVRIGDTVTIGTFSGSVSKIRIRATTITDFDRKEVIIPNKAFVTERLINWSLTDTITRVVIRLGVAYGSDLDKVREILLKAAHEHPKVMHDPEPTVFFTTFGASTLDHELRLYVRELRDRSYTVDELNRTIDRLCRENGINIAFNQLEVHLRNDKGDELTEVKRDNNGKSNGGDIVPAQ